MFLHKNIEHKSSQHCWECLQCCLFGLWNTNQANILQIVFWFLQT